MATIPLLAPQTAANASPIPFDTGAYAQVVLIADNLATTETVTVYQAVTGTSTSYVPAVNASGAVASLTATLPTCILPGGSTYAITKSATAGACGVYLSPVGPSN